MGSDQPCSETKNPDGRGKQVCFLFPALVSFLDPIFLLALAEMFRFIDITVPNSATLPFYSTLLPHTLMPGYKLYTIYVFLSSLAIFNLHKIIFPLA